MRKASSSDVVLDPKCGHHGLAQSEKKVTGLEVTVREIGTKLGRAYWVFRHFVDGKFESNRSDVLTRDVQQLLRLESFMISPNKSGLEKNSLGTSHLAPLGA